MAGDGNFSSDIEDIANRISDIIMSPATITGLINGVGFIFNEIDKYSPVTRINNTYRSALSSIVERLITAKNIVVNDAVGRQLHVTQ
ncbi:hypothetical protein [Rahnella victoriana]|uniref:Uncharacterized protein n=1 Tax=Rahnella victoriana TaxID=1510570 RepID=A0ABS0DYL3_9GAMM|nr:hypothetical protein [Rahnella victoriana]MBF7958528.1 hypothetical protein [Rahnella victoriana]